MFRSPFFSLSRENSIDYIVVGRKKHTNCKIRRIIVIHNRTMNFPSTFWFRVCCVDSMHVYSTRCVSFTFFDSKSFFSDFFFLLAIALSSSSEFLLLSVKKATSSLAWVWISNGNIYPFSFSLYMYSTMRLVCYA